VLLPEEAEVFGGIAKSIISFYGGALLDNTDAIRIRTCGHIEKLNKSSVLTGL
jgi:hypothetical protein